MIRMIHSTILLRKKLSSVIPCIPVIIVTAGKEYSIAAAKTVKVSKTPTAYFPVRLIIQYPKP